MNISDFVYLIELDGDEAPKVASPKEIKVEPNAPLLQAKDKQPLILQSEKPEEETEQYNLMSTYRSTPLERGKNLQAPAGTVASKLSLAKGPIRKPEPPKILQPPTTMSNLRLAPTEEMFIPSILESKKKFKKVVLKKRTTLQNVGVTVLSAILGPIARHFEEMSKERCYQKTGVEGFTCRKKFRLKEIEVKIEFLKKRYKECFEKIPSDNRFLRDNCIETTVAKLQELRDKYKEILAETYEENKNE